MVGVTTLPVAATARAEQQTAATAREARPNLLFMVADDLDAFSRQHTPNLDAFEKRAVSFRRAYANHPWCAPSRDSFLTGHARFGHEENYFDYRVRSAAEIASGWAAETGQNHSSVRMDQLVEDGGNCGPDNGHKVCRHCCSSATGSTPAAGTCGIDDGTGPWCGFDNLAEFSFPKLEPRIDAPRTLPLYLRNRGYFVLGKGKLFHGQPKLHQTWNGHPEAYEGSNGGGCDDNADPQACRAWYQEHLQPSPPPPSPPPPPWASQPALDKEADEATALMRQGFDVYEPTDPDYYGPYLRGETCPRGQHPFMPASFLAHHDDISSWGPLDGALPFTSGLGEMREWGADGGVTNFDPALHATHDEETAAWAAARLAALGRGEEGGGKPFFMLLGFVRPHEPMFSRQEHFDANPLDEVRASLVADPAYRNVTASALANSQFVEAMYREGSLPAGHMADMLAYNGQAHGGAVDAHRQSRAAARARSSRRRAEAALLAQLAQLPAERTAGTEPGAGGAAVPTREQVAAQFFESGAAVPTRAQVEASFFAHFDAYADPRLSPSRPAAARRLRHSRVRAPHRNSLVQGAADGIGDLVKFVQAYRAAVHSVDEQIGRVLRALSSAGLDGGTVVAVTSDHGMQLGRKGQLYKNMPWEHTARVPLLVRVPTLPAGHGVGCDHVVSLIDLLPTFADLAGVNVQKQSQSFDGTSLLPLLREPRCASCAAGSGVAITKGTAWGQAPIALGLKGRDGRPPWWSVRDARWRLIIYVNSPQVELYDHDADPEEVVNLAGGAEGSEARRAEAALREALCAKVPDPDHPLTFGESNPCIGHRMPRSPRLP